MLNLSKEICDALLKILWDESITGLAIVERDGTFMRANSTFCRIVEYTEAELKRLRFQDITDPADLRADEEMAEMTAGGIYPSYQMTKNYITKTKKIQPVLLRVTGLWVNGQFIYFVAEVAPIEPAQEHAQATEIEGRAKRRVFWKWFVTNWQLVAAAIGGLGWLTAEIWARVAR